MRVLLIGLTIAAIEITAAHAVSCSVTRAEVRVVDTDVLYAGVGEVKRSELIGQTFRISRYTARREWRFSKPIGANKLLGYEGYELKGAAGTFEVMRDHVDGSPAVTPVSWASGFKGAYAQIRWGGGRPERVTVGEDLDYLLGGPLSALTLRVTGCH
jgi:hypothetical protein